MKDFFKNISNILIIILLALFLVKTYQYNKIYEKYNYLLANPITREKTVVKYQLDTLRFTQYIPVNVEKTILRIDTVKIKEKDKIDDDKITLPIEQRQYKDSSYVAWISGYQPKLDSIYVFQKTKIVEREKQTILRDNNKFNIGVGPYIGIDKSGKTSYGIGISLSYSLFKF